MTDRMEAIQRAKELAAARTETVDPAADASGTSGSATRPAPGVRARARAKGPSAGRILAAAGATAAGVGLVGVMAANAQSDPAPVDPGVEYRTVVVQVPASDGSGPVTGTVTQVSNERVVPAESQSQRQPATETRGS